ncbi:interleukin-34 isoform X1 [Clupea harengus]|uniref:Interleukin-34 isoform X1 n=1 Tax=Clupea harengus TaxID=7950 RepID=A0A6P8EVE5_CLUHA|nr:interleukin-34 isoform X1 [Clupea harengus]XP_031420227.1 interleukin-34 isoform X1 [Clupea harengus]XP_031420228.1 interleukin-34 isoform X1 [Clupea harengus]
MAGSGAWILGWVFGLVLTQSVSTSTSPICKALTVVNNSLGVKERIHFMRHNMPINYTIRVHYEEIFKLKNVSRLRRNVEGLEDVDLQVTWLRVNLGILKKITSVLPKKHPSYNFTSNLETLFLSVEQIFPEGRDPPERIQQIWDALGSSLGKRWNVATPKSLLDNCYQTMHCIFSSCFPSSSNYCQRAHWRNEKKAQHQGVPKN